MTGRRGADGAARQSPGAGTGGTAPDWVRGALLSGLSRMSDMRSDRESVISKLRERSEVLHHQLRVLEERSAHQAEAGPDSICKSASDLRDGCIRLGGAIRSLERIEDEDFWEQELLHVTIMLRDLEEAAISALAKAG